MGGCGWVGAETDLDSVQFADATVANQLAGEAKSRIGALLASDLKDTAITANGIAEHASLFDSQSQRLLQKNILAGLGGGNRGQRMPLVGRSN